MDDWRHAGFGIYIHWPFCQSKCPYCDFNSYVSDSIDEKAWLTAYLAEIDRYARAVPNRIVNSVYFGGGTPSLMSPDTVNRIIENISSRWSFANNVEITLEANPSSVEYVKFRDFSDAGVNRISLGIQSLNDEHLRLLGRTHTAKDALEALNVAQSVFDQVSFDLIYARQTQTADEWQAELSRALGFGTSHLSLYQLTIEPNTVFGARHSRGLLRNMPLDDVAEDMFFRTLNQCRDAGFCAYEVSNFATPGNQSKHNMIYWQCGDFLGIGPGAHGRLTIDGARYSTESHASPNVWLAETRSLSGESRRDVLSVESIMDEYLLMSLRTSGGLDTERLYSIDGYRIAEDIVTDLKNMNLLENLENMLVATDSGRMVLNAVITELSSNLVKPR